MAVVSHQGVSVDESAEAADGLCEDGQEQEAIVVIEVDVVVVVAPGRDSMARGYLGGEVAPGFAQTTVERSASNASE